MVKTVHFIIQDKLYDFKLVYAYKHNKISKIIRHHSIMHVVKSAKWNKVYCE